MIEFYNYLLSFAICSVIFVPLERLFSAHRQKYLRKEWFTDLAFYTGQFFVFTHLTIFLLVSINSYLDEVMFVEFRALVKQQPLWLQVIEVVVLCDVCIYWAHRLSHKFDFLWRFHRVHHTAPRLDWLAAYREHPFDNIYTRLVENLPALILGFSMETLAGFVAFRGLWALFIHSNTNFSMGPLKYLLGSPRLHHWHHDVECNSKCNFANLMPLIDVIFGTFHDPGHMPRRYGLPGKESHNYMFQLVQPLVPAALLNRLMRPEVSSSQS